MGIKLVRLEHTNASTYGGKLLVSTATGNAFYISSSAYWIPIENGQLATKYYVDLVSTGSGLWNYDSISSDFIYPTTYPPKILIDDGYLLYRSFALDAYIFDSNANQHNFISISNNATNVAIKPDSLDNIFFTVSGISQFNNVNVLGTLTARNLYFESTTAVEIVTSGSHLEIQGSVSITGTPSSTRNLFDVNNPSSYFVVTTAGNIGIHQSQPQEHLHFSGTGILFECTNFYINAFQSVTGDIDLIGNINVNGLKNFRIDHPDPEKTKSHYLVHSALEGPNPSVYIDGKIEQIRFKRNIYIKLPSYFKYLVSKNDVKVYLESVGYKKHEYVKKIDNDEIVIKKNYFKKSSLNYFIMADRKLKNKFEVEIKK